MHPGSAVEQDLVVEQDAAFVGAHEAGDRVECQRFSSAARTKQDRHAGGGLKFEIQRKAGGIGTRRVLLANSGLDHGASIIKQSGAVRRDWMSGDSPA